MKTRLAGITLRLAIIALAGTSIHASLVTDAITFQSGIYTTTPSPLATSADYVAAFNALPSLSAIAALPVYDNVTNNATFGTGTTNIGEHFQVGFTLGAGDAGLYQFRFGVDFGLGGTVLVDGAQLDINTSDMWWNGSYATPSQYLTGATSLGAGSHTIDVYGFEGCCDGPQQGQWSGPSVANAQPFQTFATATPEPATYGLVGMAGLALLLLKRRS